MNTNISLGQFLGAGHSWYSNLGNGFRVDHVFVNQSDKNKIDQCFYLHEKRIDKTSDHSIMEVELV